MLNINDLNEATQMQIALMKFDTRFAHEAVHSNNQELIERARELIERNPSFIARAYEYFPDVLRDADSKHQIITAWICGECDDEKIAKKIFDKAMASGFTPRRIRSRVKRANAKINGTTKRERGTSLAERIVELDGTHSFGADANASFRIKVVEQPEVARALARREREAAKK